VNGSERAPFAQLSRTSSASSAPPQITRSHNSSEQHAATEGINIMTTNPISSSPSPNKLQSKNSALKAEDFINMMVTQLQNQDPLEPAKNSELLAQMSQIGQLQTSTALQDSLKSLVLQNNLGAAGNLIGKMVEGLDDNGEPLEGLVTSVRVEGDEVFLEMDSGKSLKLARVTAITSSAEPATAAAG
jgi:flagellar basal-body rod modification protein FlgD